MYNLGRILVQSDLTRGGKGHYLCRMNLVNWFYQFDSVEDLPG